MTDLVGHLWVGRRRPEDDGWTLIVDNVRNSVRSRRLMTGERHVCGPLSPSCSGRSGPWSSEDPLTLRGAPGHPQSQALTAF